MSYGKVVGTFWTDKKIAALSQDGKMLALYFLTSPHRNILGCCRVPDGYIMADLDWDRKRIRDAVAEINGWFVVRDNEGWTHVVNQFRYDPISNPNHARAAIKIAQTVPPESPAYRSMAPKLVAALKAIHLENEWLPEEAECHPDAIPMPSRCHPDAIPDGKPTPGPYHYQDHYQDQDTVPERADALERVPKPDDCKLAVDAWNELADETGLPKAQRLTEQRRRSLKQRLAECGGIDGWHAAMARIRGSPFLLGQGPKGWRADLDFVLQAKSFTKLMEGSYDDRKQHRAGADDAAMRAAIFAALGDELDPGGLDPGGDAGHDDLGPGGGEIIDAPG